MTAFGIGVLVLLIFASIVKPKGEITGVMALLFVTLVPYSIGLGILKIIELIFK